MLSILTRILKQSCKYKLFNVSTREASRKGRLSTLDLLIEIARFVRKEKNTVLKAAGLN